MEDKQTLAEKERSVSLPPPSPPPPSGSVRNVDDAEGKKQNCLCAPTTHAGSFRCRLHRKPPPSPVSSQLAAKRGFSAQKMSFPKVKLALQYKQRQGCGKKTPSTVCSPSSGLGQELPKLSRLSRTSVSGDQNQSSLPDQEALTTPWKASNIVASREEALESTEKVVDLDPMEEDHLPSKDRRYIRPLVKLPSI